MNYDMMNNNRLSLTGTISSPVTFTHEVLGESFFETTIEVKRLSGMTDVIPLTISDRLMCERAARRRGRGDGGRAVSQSQQDSRRKI